MKFAVTGSTGLIGSAVVADLRAEGHDVRRLVRRTPSAPDEIRWDPSARTVDRDALEGTGAVVHLAGAGVGDRRWTDEYKRTIRDSRVNGTATISEACALLGIPVLLSSSAIGYYGDTGDNPVDEDAPSGGGFLADVTRAWESTTRRAEDAGVRVVHLRTGVVLARDGGTLGGPLPVPLLPLSLLNLFQLGIGGRIGSGRQWVSWISITDQVRAIRFLLDTDGISGPVNLTAPEPVRNKDWVKAIGRAVHRPAVVPVPGFAARLVVGQFAEEAVLYSQRVLPRRLDAAGFTFEHSDIDSALQAELA